MTTLTAKHARLRFVIIHIHPTSARLRFLISPVGCVVFPTALPVLSDLVDDQPGQHGLSVHPAAFVGELCRLLQVDTSRLEVASDFRCWVNVPGGYVPVYLLSDASPHPFEPPKGYRWIELPDSFQLIPIERLILRRVYDFLLGHAAP